MLTINFELQTLEFEVILDQRDKDWTTHFVTNYEWLSAETTKLYWIVMEMRSKMGGTCARFYSPYGPDKDTPYLPPPAPLF